jgi:hypothetical protein
MSSANPSGVPRSQPVGRADNELFVRMPPSNKGLLAAAVACLVIPIVALMWVSSYSKATPRLWGIPFFFWYQFAWVFVTSALTYTAHRLVIAARGQSDEPYSGHEGDRGLPPDRPVADGGPANRTPGSPS